MTIKENQLFLDDNGDVWVTHSPAGTGKYYWWCREYETDRKRGFSISFIEERIKTYQKDSETLDKNINIENNMFKLIKKISKQIIRKEILKEDEWSGEDLVLLNMLNEWKFSIKYDAEGRYF